MKESNVSDDLRVKHWHSYEHTTTCRRFLRFVQASMDFSDKLSRDMLMGVGNKSVLIVGLAKELAEHLLV